MKWRQMQNSRGISFCRGSNLSIQWRSVVRFRVWSPWGPNALLYETVDPTFPDRNAPKNEKKPGFCPATAVEKDKEEEETREKTPGWNRIFCQK